MQKSIGIQYFRSFACIAVFLSHLIGAMPETMLQFGNVNLNDTPLRIFWGGYSGVIIFFVISGFFQGASNSKLTVRNYCRGIIKRHLRIYPAYLLVFAVAMLARNTSFAFDSSHLSIWICNFWKNQIPFKQYLLSIFLVSPFDADALNPVVWTLRIELRMCFFLPFVQWMMKRWNPIAVCCLCILLGVFIPFFAYLPVFAIGMIACRYKSCILKWIRNKKLLVSSAAFLLMDFSYLCNWLGWETMAAVRHNVTAFGAAIMVLCVYEVTENRTRMGVVFEKLGDQSYYFYLVHMIMLIWFRFIPGYLGFGAYAVVVICVTYIFTIGLYQTDRWIHNELLHLQRKG